MYISVSDLRFNTKTLELRRGQKTINLTKQELKLLHLLLVHKNTPVSRGEILEHIWHASVNMKTRIVDVYIGYLRKKIDHGFEKQLIKSVRGKGYTISED